MTEIVVIVTVIAIGIWMLSNFVTFSFSQSANPNYQNHLDSDAYSENSNATVCMEMSIFLTKRHNQHSKKEAYQSAQFLVYIEKFRQLCPFKRI